MTDAAGHPLPTSAYARIGNGDRTDGTAETFHSSVLTRGPWHPDHQHAGPPIALVSRALLGAAQAHGLTHLARITANLLRPVPIGLLTIETATDYGGRNAGHFSARLLAEGGKEVARFTALAQREVPLELPPDLPGHPLPSAPRAPGESAPVPFPFGSKLVGYPDLVETRVARGRFFGGPSAI